MGHHGVSGQLVVALNVGADEGAELAHTLVLKNRRKNSIFELKSNTAFFDIRKLG